MTQNELDLLEHRIEKLESQFSSQSTSPLYSIWNFAIWFVVSLILIFVLATTLIRIQRLTDNNSRNISSSQSDVTLQRANEAVNSVELVLSFLEGASVLLAVALGASALYGLRQTKELREEFEEKLAEISKTQQYIRSKENQLDSLDRLQSLLNSSQETLTQTINDVSLLLQADQEFRLRNHMQAYEFITQVLERDTEEDNISNHLALYMAGWLEIHHIPEKLDDGLNRLKKLSETSPNWASAIAAYGVALRRKAMKLKTENAYKSEQLLNEAHGILLQAVGKAPKLVDFNRESFWGPIGGILRDEGDIEGAINAYKRALQVTPGSSYPQGNLANLYLRKAQSDNTFQEIMLEAFESTLDFARAELNQTPNDYFLIMDIAMAETILGFKDKKKLESAKNHLEQALQMNTSAELLGVSNRGWSFLRNSLPEGRQWNNVRNALDDALEQISEAIKYKEN